MIRLVPGLRTTAQPFYSLGVIFRRSCWDRNRLHLGMGGCKVVSDLAVKNGALLTVHLQTPDQLIAITVQAATIQWILKLEFGMEFIEMQERERALLEQFLTTQMNIAP
ncbi:MAG: PilZ domain-containing protein [Nitrospirota bacterium]